MFKKEIYTKRRNALCEKLGSGLVLLPGNSDSPMNYPENMYLFRQNSHFIYFAGIDIPDLFVAIDVDTRETILFADELTINDIIWTGPKESYKEIAKKAGIETVLPSRAVYEVVKNALNSKRKVHYLPPYRMDSTVLISELLEIPVRNVKDNSSVDLIKAVVELRSVKGPEEIEELNFAARLGYEMHYSVMTGAYPGVKEMQLAAKAEGIALAGGHNIAFPIILSQRGEILHGHDHSLTLEKGNLLICDAGGESFEHYASDFTRTIPVGGKFSSVQKELYQIVLDANNKAFELIKPGIPYREVHLSSCLVIAEGLKSMGILKGDMLEAVNMGAHALFMVHGLGHMMGLDVHDMEDLGENYVGYDEEFVRSNQFGLRSLRLGKKLKPGYVLTVEPGLYFIPALIEKWKSEKILTDFINYEKAGSLIGTGGIRIEDDAIVTNDGCIMPGDKRLPVTIEEIESLY